MDTSGIADTSHGERDAAVVRDYEGGASFREIAGSHSLSLATVSAILRRNGRTARGREDVRATWGAKGLCLACGKSRVAGFETCEMHTARKAPGTCRRCSRPARPGAKVCEEHAREQNANSARLRAEARAQGLCINCRKNAALAHSRDICTGCWFRRVAAKNLGDAERAEELRALWESQDGRCAYTGEALIVGMNMSLDHKIPRSRGGSHDASNLQWVTLAVNVAKNNLSEREFFELCAAVVRGSRRRT